MTYPLLIKLSKNVGVVVLILVYLTGQWGCATGRYDYPSPEPLAEEYRAQLRTIRVSVSQAVPIIELDKPLPPSTGGLTGMGRGMVKGAEKSWDWWMDLCSGEVWTFKSREHTDKSRGHTGNGENRLVGVAIGMVAVYAIPLILVGVCYVLTPPVTILGGLGGTIYGVFPSSPNYPPYVEEVEGIFHAVPAQYPLQKHFQDAFLKTARFRTSHKFVVASGAGGQLTDKTFKEDEDTDLELKLEKMYLKRLAEVEGDMNPPMALILFVGVKMQQGVKKTVLYEQTFLHEMKKPSYVSWAYRYYPHHFILKTHEGFVKDLEKAYKQLAEQIVQKLFHEIPSVS